MRKVEILMLLIFFVYLKSFSQDFKYSFQVSNQNKSSIEITILDDYNIKIVTSSDNTFETKESSTKLNYNVFMKLLSGISQYSFNNSAVRFFASDYKQFQQTLFLPNRAWFVQNYDSITFKDIFNNEYFERQNIHYLKINVTLFYYTGYDNTEKFIDNLILNQKSFDLKKCLRQNYDLIMLFVETLNSIDKRLISQDIKSLLVDYASSK